MKARPGTFPPNKSAGLSARSCVTSQVHEAILWAIFFCPSRASSLYFSKAPNASRSQNRQSSFLLTKCGSRGCNAAGCANTNGHRPTNTRSSFSAPEAVLSEVEQRFGCVRTARSASRLTGQNVRVLHYPLYDFDLRATHARTLLPAALASVSFGFVLVRVRLCLGSNSLAI